MTSFPRIPCLPHATEGACTVSFLRPFNFGHDFRMQGTCAFACILRYSCVPATILCVLGHNTHLTATCNVICAWCIHRCSLGCTNGVVCFLLSVGFSLAALKGRVPKTTQAWHDLLHYIGTDLSKCRVPALVVFP
jgi:hypothetical protein